MQQDAPNARPNPEPDAEPQPLQNDLSTRRAAALFGASFALVAIVAMAVATRPSPLFIAILVSTLTTTTIIAGLFPRSPFFALTYVNLMAVYVAVFGLFAEDIFGEINSVVAGFGFALPMLAFVVGCWRQRAAVSAVIAHPDIRSEQAFTGAFTWLLPVAVVGIAVLAVSWLDSSLVNTDRAFVLVMFIIASIVRYFSSNIALFLADTGLLIEDFFQRIAALVVPAFAFLTFYALLVIFFAAIFSLLSLFSGVPHIRISGVSRGLSFSEAIHFSIVTISTVGYGDIVPISNTSRLLASVEVICGVMLLLFGVSELLEYAREQRRKRGDRKSAPATRLDTQRPACLHTQPASNPNAQSRLGRPMPPKKTPSSKKPTTAPQPSSGKSAIPELLTVLDLEQLELNLFRGRSPQNGWQRVFGGQVLGQALVATLRTVPEERIAHSLHAYFLLPGDPKIPIIYEVERIRDGGSFTTRRVKGIQHGKAMFSMSVSLHKAEPGLDHQSTMPKVPAPEDLPNAQQLVQRFKGEIPDDIRNYWQRERPIEMRPVDVSRYLDRGKHPPEQAMWIRASDRLPDNFAFHQCVLAYASDFTLLDTSLIAHGRLSFDHNMQMASLDHALWYHRSFRADDWLLYVQDSPSSHGGRGFCRGSVYTRDGVLVASVAQEGLIRERPTAFKVK